MGHRIKCLLAEQLYGNQGNNDGSTNQVPGAPSGEFQFRNCSNTDTKYDNKAPPPPIFNEIVTCNVYTSVGLRVSEC